MTSNIQPSTIQVNYPIAGQDNDSQGFRDNFLNIANNFTTAASEITALQSNTMLLSGTSTLTNGAVINGAAGSQIVGVAESATGLGAISNTVSLNFGTSYMYYASSTTGPFSLAFTWPATGSYGKIRFWVNFSSTAHTMTLPAGTYVGTSALAGISGLVYTPSMVVPSVVSGALVHTVTPTIGNYMFEFATMNGGGVVTIVPLMLAQ